jgi:hypothetical protein
MSNYKVIKKTTECTEYHGVFVTNTGFLRETPCTPWLFFFGIIRFFSLDNLLGCSKNPVTFFYQAAQKLFSVAGTHIVKGSLGFVGIAVKPP